jgi:hypothetical protein
VQAGLQTNLVDWREPNGRAYWFTIAWVTVLTLQYVVFYKTPGTPEEEHEAARRRIQEWARMRGFNRRAERSERREKARGGGEERSERNET